ncbi:MAG TPA: N-acetylmuramidase family protein, partial [Ramlibacter sp.]|nr:N-acetylmuramidase family protein [Ramlibacter sp.]
ALARGGRVVVQQVTTDAFGNAIGQGFVDAKNQPDGGAAFVMDHANRLQQMNPMNLPTRSSLPPQLAAMGFGEITTDGGNRFGDAVIVGSAPEPVEFSRAQYEAMGRGLIQAADAPRPDAASDGRDRLRLRSRTIYSESTSGVIHKGGLSYFLNFERDADGLGTYVRAIDPIESEERVSPAAVESKRLASVAVEPTSKFLQESDFELVAQQLNVENTALKAVAQVESAGGGFLPSGDPKILFEAHLFSRFTGGQYDESNPAISSPKWNRSLYVGGQGEYDRLSDATALDPEAALRATSWGRFQILGDNFKLAGFTSVQNFVGAMYMSERDQLQAFSSFVQNRGLVDALRNKDWATFARGYNGPRYQENHYDDKMFNAYKAYRRE